MGINLLGLLGIPFFLIGIISINFAEFFANWAIYFKVKDPDWEGASDIAINKRYFLGGLSIALAIFSSFASAMFL